MAHGTVDEIAQLNLEAQYRNNCSNKAHNDNKQQRQN